jgi:hypothetical protein
VPADVLHAAGRAEEAAATLVDALDRYERKRNLPRRARCASGSPIFRRARRQSEAEPAVSRRLVSAQSGVSSRRCQRILWWRMHSSHGKKVRMQLLCHGLKRARLLP